MSREPGIRSARLWLWPRFKNKMVQRVISMSREKVNPDKRASLGPEENVAGGLGSGSLSPGLLGDTALF